MADIVIPARVIRYMVENSDGDLSVAEGCRRCLDAYLGDEKDG